MVAIDGAQKGQLILSWQVVCTIWNIAVSDTSQASQPAKSL
jgi:hypothetical protein